MIAVFMESIDYCSPALVAFKLQKAAAFSIGCRARAPLNRWRAIVPTSWRCFRSSSRRGAYEHTGTWNGGENRGFFWQLNFVNRGQHTLSIYCRKLLPPPPATSDLLFSPEECA